MNRIGNPEDVDPSNFTDLMEAMIFDEMDEKTTILKILSQPELDEWTYPVRGPETIKPKKFPLLTSTSFILKMYEVAGVLEDAKRTLDINWSEFTTKDLYQTNLFDLDPERPAACEEADPHVPYC